MREIIRVMLVVLLVYLGWAPCWADSDSTQVGKYGDLFKETLKAADDLLAHVTAIPDSEEVVIGREITKRVNEERILIQGDRKKRVQRIGHELANQADRKGIVYTFHVLDSDVLNAFAIPGGNIWITEAMLNFLDNDDQLAGILGHEIAHVDLRHCIRAIQYQIWIMEVLPEHSDYVKIGYSLVNSSYSELNELEADKNGVQIMFQAGYDPDQMVNFMTKMEALEESAGEYDQPDKDDQIGQAVAQVNDFLRSHPLSRERKEKLQAYIQDHLRNEAR